MKSIFEKVPKFVSNMQKFVYRVFILQAFSVFFYYFFLFFCRIFANISFSFFVKRQRPGPRGRTCTHIRTCACVGGVCGCMCVCVCLGVGAITIIMIIMHKLQNSAAGNQVTCVWRHCLYVCVCACLCVCVCAAANERQPQIAAVFSLHFPIVSQNGVRQCTSSSPTPSLSPSLHVWGRVALFYSLVVFA